MNQNIKPSDRAPVLDILAPASRSATTYDTEYFDMGQFENLLATLLVGDYTNGGKVDLKAQKAKDSGGTGVTDMSGKAITQLLDSNSPADSNVAAQINVRATELGDDGATPAVKYTHARFRLTVTTAAANTALVVQGFDARQQPATDDDSVKEIIA